MGYQAIRYNIDKEIKANIFLLRLGYSKANAQRILDRKRLFQDNKIVSKKDTLHIGEAILYEFIPNNLGLLPIHTISYYSTIESNNDFVKLDSIQSTHKGCNIYNACIFNKPPFLLSHPIGLNDKPTILDQTKFLFGANSNVCHRLDYDTSGLMLCAMDRKSEIFFKNLFTNKMIFKEYLALLKGEIKTCLAIESTISNRKDKGDLHIKGHSSKEIITAIHTKSNLKSTLEQKNNSQISLIYPIKCYTSLQECMQDIQVKKAFSMDNIAYYDIHALQDSVLCKEYSNFYASLKTSNIYTLARLIPLSGKTHQLRIHTKAINAPISGDTLYSRDDTLARFFFDLDKWKNKQYYINSFAYDSKEELSIFTEFLTFFYACLDSATHHNLAYRIMQDMRSYYTGSKRLMLHARKLRLKHISISYP